jgi:competence protein ComEA
MSPRNNINNILYFTKTERQGIYTLVVLMLAVLGMHSYLQSTFSLPKINHKEVQLILQDWEDSTFDPTLPKVSGDTLDKPWTKEEKNVVNQSAEKNQAGNSNSKKLFHFDPNTVSKDSLIQLGFSVKTAQNIDKYRSKGGRFTKKEDLRKIYGINVDHLSHLEPFIHFQIETKQKFTPKSRKKKANTLSQRIAQREIVFLDINSADMYEWMQLKGIGAKRAEHIVAYRDELGGFYKKEQVKEVWSIPDSLYYEIADQLLESESYKFIPINSIEQDSLYKHPYFNYKKAMILCNYRKNHGPFHSIEDLRAIRPFSESFLQKVAPYLDFELPMVSN